MGHFLIMGLIGLVIALVVNMFFQSPAMQLRGLGAGRADLHRPDRLGHPEDQEHLLQIGDDTAVAGKAAIMGALRLYLDFLNIFLFLLRFMGNRR